MFAAAGYRAEAGAVWFRCCPARLISAFTLEALRWFMWMTWAPAPPGMFDEAVDPRFIPALERLKYEQMRIEREELDILRKEREAQ